LVIKSKNQRAAVCQNKEVKDASEKFKCIGNRYNIGMIFINKHAPRSSLMKARLGKRPAVSAAFPVDVAEATLAKQADL
jgi:hypothetical protein